MGAGVSIYEGIHKLADPHPIHDAHVNYIVLGIAIALEGVSTWKALSEFNARYRGKGLLAALRQSKDAALLTVVLEDLAAMAGLTVALVGVLAADLLGFVAADGIASIIIGHSPRCASSNEPPMPRRTPISPPMIESDTASITNWAITSRLRAPNAMRSPISLVRSVTDTSMMFMMPMPPTISDTPATEARRIDMMRDDSARASSISDRLRT